MNWISLSSESPGVFRDENGVPVEWTLLRIGSNPICQEGKDGSLVLTADAMQRSWNKSPRGSMCWGKSF